MEGDTPGNERDQAMRDFREGRILGLANVELFSEGLDVPGIEAAIDLRPTQSLTLWLQFCGRALRPAYGKPHAIILDHAGNARRHGLPDDQREWSLIGREKKTMNGNGASVVKICPSCFGAQRPGQKMCRYCGAMFPVHGREVEEVSGELREVARKPLSEIERTHRLNKQTLEDAMRRYGENSIEACLVRNEYEISLRALNDELARVREYKNSHSFDGLVALARKRGYKNPEGWARIVIREREAKRRQMVMAYRQGGGG